MAVSVAGIGADVSVDGTGVLVGLGGTGVNDGMGTPNSMPDRRARLHQVDPLSEVVLTYRYSPVVRSSPADPAGSPFRLAGCVR